jgi:hypothetical protein
MNMNMQEYDTHRMTAYAEWADDNNLGVIARRTQRHKFGRLVTDYIRGKSGDHHPAVKRLGEVVKKQAADMLTDLQNPLKYLGIEGKPVGTAKLIQTNANYVWRKFDYDKLDAAIKRFGQNGVTKMVKGAILEAQPHLADDLDLLERIATGYVNNIRNQAAQLGDQWSMAWEAGDFENLKSILVDEAGARIDPADVDNIIQRIRGKDEPAAGSQNLKRRMFLAEGYVEREITQTFSSFKRLR